MVENLPYKAGDPGSIPGQGTKIRHATGHLSLHAPTTEPAPSGAQAPQDKEKPPRAATKTQRSPINRGMSGSRGLERGLLRKGRRH